VKQQHTATATSVLTTKSMYRSLSAQWLSERTIESSLSRPWLFCRSTRPCSYNKQRNIPVTITKQSLSTFSASLYHHATLPPMTNFPLHWTCVVGISGGIVTHNRLDNLGIKCWCAWDFPHPSKPTLGHTQPPVQWAPGLFRRSTAALTTDPHVVPTLTH
jgi:hypothetical protein